jgi:peptidoglycan/xylan/chitin deacetylase (PgdA/CDA1 family)
MSGLIQTRIASATSTERQSIAQILAKHETSAEQVLNARTPNWSLLREICAQLDLNYEAWLSSEQPYLTTSQVKKLIADGFAVGSHSVDHPLLKDIEDQQKLEQILASTNAITSQFSLNYRVFAFPYGEFGIDPSFLARLQASQSLDICFGTRGITLDEFEPFLIQRVLSEGHNGTFRSHIHREMRIQKHRVKTQRAIVKRTRFIT